MWQPHTLHDRRVMQSWYNLALSWTTRAFSFSTINIIIIIVRSTSLWPILHTSSAGFEKCCCSADLHPSSEPILNCCQGQLSVYIKGPYHRFMDSFSSYVNIFTCSKVLGHIFVNFKKDRINILFCKVMPHSAAILFTFQKALFQFS